MNNKLLGLLALILFVIIGNGLLWLAIQSDNAVSALLSFAAGLSMIFLPCTLPLVFVIVPLAAKEENPARGLGVAIAFSLGLAATLAVYGIVTAFLGGYFGLDEFTRTMFVVAGAAALLFGLTELGLLRVPLPVFTHNIPAWVNQGYGKSFLLGLFLGNAGIGCPNPAFYVLLTYIASTGSAATGAWLGLVHGLGRAAPLIFLVLLTLLGMNPVRSHARAKGASPEDSGAATSNGVKSVQWISKVSGKVHLWTGFGLVFAGAFIITIGLLGMHWWEDSIFHAAWNQFMYNVHPNFAEQPGHPVREGIFEAGAAAGWWSLIIFILIPMVWYKISHGIKSAGFWIIGALLLVLGVLASSGLIEVERGHGEAEGNHVESGHQ